MKKKYIGLIILAVFVISIDTIIAWEEDSTCDTNQDCPMVVYAINAFDGSETFSDALCNTTIYYMNGTILINNSPMTNLGNGWYNYTLNIAEDGYYRVAHTCVRNNTAGVLAGILKVGNSTTTIAETIEDNTIQINDTLEILENISLSFLVELSDAQEILAGNKYRATLFITDYSSNPRNADASINIKLEDPTLNEIALTTMDANKTGKYTYSYTTSDAQTDGMWITTVNGSVNGIEFSRIDYWELESNPAEITIQVTDTTQPTIGCTIYIANEGSSSQEYQYRWWVTNVVTGQYADGTAIDSGSAAKNIAAGQNWSVSKTMTIGSDYLGDTLYCKAEVFYGTEKSGASKSFIVTEEEETTTDNTVAVVAGTPKEPPKLVEIPESIVEKFGELSIFKKVLVIIFGILLVILICLAIFILVTKIKEKHPMKSVVKEKGIFD